MLYTEYQGLLSRDEQLKNIGRAIKSLPKGL